MPFFTKLKQKMLSLKSAKNNKRYLAVFGVFFLIIFLFPNLTFANTFTDWTITPLLQGVLKIVTMILGAADILFAYIVDPANMKTIMTNQVVYTTWTTVRDIFNVVFIMVLLFSAFATIFQSAASYNYKKILLNLVIMALLVNFSYPIARFIIDASNVLMFGFLNGLGGSNSFSTLVSGTGIERIAKSESTDITYLLSAIIFTFILAITLLVIAVLLVIRTIALTIYIIFSPIGFVGQVAPGTGLAAAGSKWWKDFMQQCFAGPIMIFYLYVATQMFAAISAGQPAIKTLAQTAIGSTTKDFTTLTSAAAFFAIPIIILWLGIIQAQQSGIAGAGAVVNAGKRAGKWLIKNPALGSVGFISKKSGLTEGAKQSWNKNVTQRLDRSQKNRDAKWAGRLGDRSAGERNMKSRAAQYDKDNESIDDLKKWSSSGDAAAAYALAIKGKIDQKVFNEAMLNIKDTKIKDSLLGKAEETRMDVTLKYKLENDQRKATSDPTKKNWATIADVSTSEYGNLTAEAWSKQKNLQEQFTHGPHNPNAAEIEAGARAAFAALRGPARIEAIKRMSGGNVTAVT
jgi:hypothetical protein